MMITFMRGEAVWKNGKSKNKKIHTLFYFKISNNFILLIYIQKLLKGWFSYRLFWSIELLRSLKNGSLKILIVILRKLCIKTNLLGVKNDEKNIA